MIDNAIDKLSRFILGDFMVALITMIGIYGFIDMFGVHNALAGYLTYLFMKEKTWTYEGLTKK